MQVNNFPFEVACDPTELHFAPALTAAFAIGVKENTSTSSTIIEII
jgi:hypothetical protein